MPAARHACLPPGMRSKPPRPNCRNRWGRVGEERNAQNALRGPMPLEQAKRDFTTKFKDKTKNEWASRANFSVVSGKYTLI